MVATGEETLHILLTSLVGYLPLLTKHSHWRELIKKDHFQPSYPFCHAERHCTAPLETCFLGFALSSLLSIGCCASHKILLTLFLTRFLSGDHR